MIRSLQLQLRGVFCCANDPLSFQPRFASSSPRSDGIRSPWPSGCLLEQIASKFMMTDVSQERNDNTNNMSMHSMHGWMHVV